MRMGFPPVEAGKIPTIMFLQVQQRWEGSGRMGERGCQEAGGKIK